MSPCSSRRRERCKDLVASQVYQLRSALLNQRWLCVHISRSSVKSELVFCLVRAAVFSHESQRLGDSNIHSECESRPYVVFFADASVKFRLKRRAFFVVGMIPCSSRPRDRLLEIALGILFLRAGIQLLHQRWLRVYHIAQ